MYFEQDGQLLTGVLLFITVSVLDLSSLAFLHVRYDLRDHQIVL